LHRIHDEANLYLYEQHSVASKILKPAKKEASKMTVKIDVDGVIYERNTLSDAAATIAGAIRSGKSAGMAWPPRPESAREARMRNAFLVIAPGEVISISADFDANFDSEIYVDAKGERKYVLFSRVQVDYELAMNVSIDLDALSVMGFALSREEREHVLYLASTYGYKQGSIRV
jgi:hypothetical protein